MQGFWKPTKGKISLDGIDVNSVVVDQLRAHLGILSQNPEYFDTTIANNIAYGTVDATMDKVIKAAKSVGIHDTIELLQDGYNTKIGEFGRQLSAAEKQILAIARLLIGNARVIICDDPTSQMDKQNEHRVLEILQKLKLTRTVIIMSSQAELLAIADQVIKL